MGPAALHFNNEEVISEKNVIELIRNVEPSCYLD
jgi:hypothetical protein